MKKCVFALAASFALCLGLSIPALAVTPTFTDVPPTHWAYESIEQAADNGWVNGVGNGLYSPNNTVSNVGWICFVTRAFYSDEVDRLAMLGNSENWWSPNCSAAAINGVLEATTIGDSYFSTYKWDEELLNAPISRYDMAQVALNFMSGSGFTVSEREKKEAQDKIGDWDSIPVEYRDGVSACYALGVISGTSAGTFEGERNMSRAEAATVLCRLAQATGKGSVVTPTPTPEPTPDPTPSGGYAPADTNQDGVLTEDEVYDELMAFKEEVPEGTPWTVENHYGGGTGCAAFAFKASDQAFNISRRTVSNVDDLRIGDIIHYTSPEHWVIVIGLGDEYYFSAYGASDSDGEVSWSGRGQYTYLKDLVSQGKATIYTRYPQ